MHVDEVDAAHWETQKTVKTRNICGMLLCRRKQSNPKRVT